MARRKNKGVAAFVDPALERARLRALAGGAAPAPVAPPIKEKNTRIIQQPDGSRVPEAYYDLPPEQQQQRPELVGVSAERWQLVRKLEPGCVRECVRE